MWVRSRGLGWWIFTWVALVYVHIQGMYSVSFWQKVRFFVLANLTAIYMINELYNASLCAVPFLWVAYLAATTVFTQAIRR